MLKVCYVTHASNLTGASRSMLDLISGLDRNQIDPVVITKEDGPLVTALADMGVDCRIVPWHQHTILGVNRSLWRDAIKSVLRPWEVKRILDVLKNEKVDLVHNNSLNNDLAMDAARKAGIPYICHIRDFGTEDHGFAFANEGRTRRIAAGCARAIAISHAVANKYSPWFEPDQLIVKYNGVDCSKYCIKHDEILRKSVCVALLAGRFNPGKGQLEAIKATEILLDRGYGIKLMLVGGIGRTPEYRDACKEYIDSHGLSQSIQLLDFVQDLADIKAHSDISLTCSKMEALGRVTIEGMLAGCLVIGADTGATPEVIQDTVTGLLYKQGDPQDLAEKLEWAIGNRTHASAIARRGQEHASAQYDIKRYTEEIQQLYLDAIAK